MNGEEVRSRVLESEGKGDEVFFPTIPPETGFDRYGYFDRLTHLLDDSESGVGVDHETRSVTAFHDLFGGTPHIHIDSRGTSLFYENGGFSKHLRVFPKYLNNERFLTCIVCESGLLELFGVYEAVGTVELGKTHRVRCDFFHDLPIGGIGIAVHGSESADGFFFREIFPEILRHREE